MYILNLNIPDFVPDQLFSKAFNGPEGTLVVALCGGAFLFFGAKLYRVFAVFAGMLVGGFLGSMLGEVLRTNFQVCTGMEAILPTLAGAVLLGVMAVTMTRWALALLFGAGGFYISFKIGGAWGPATAIAAGALSYVVISYLTLKCFNQIIMMASALFGVILLRMGFMGFLSETRNEVFARLNGHYELTILAVMTIFFLIGFFFQLDDGRRKTESA